MKISVITIKAPGKLSLDTYHDPHLELEKESNKWIIIEGGDHHELAILLKQLTDDSEALLRHVTGGNRLFQLDREAFFYTILPVPTTWRHIGQSFQLVALEGCYLTLFPKEVKQLEEHIQIRWFDRPGPESTMEAILLHIIQGMIEEEMEEFYRIRSDVENHAFGLYHDDQSFVVEQLEELMTKCHHMATVFFDYHTLMDGLEFTRSKALNLSTYHEKYQQGIKVIKSYGDGVNMVQRRLEGLQQQHLLDQQAETDSRLRVLTVLSAIFLPLTLIAGIYGMNFQNMPELDNSYAYPVVLILMAALGIGMIGYFYVKGWFK